MNFENLRPALLNAERGTEMKSWLAMCECLVWDAEADTFRSFAAERMLNRALANTAKLKMEIEMDDPVIVGRLEQYADELDKAVNQ